MGCGESPRVLRQILSFLCWLWELCSAGPEAVRCSGTDAAAAHGVMGSAAAGPRACSEAGCTLSAHLESRVSTVLPDGLLASLRPHLKNSAGLCLVSRTPQLGLWPSLALLLAGLPVSSRPCLRVRVPAFEPCSMSTVHVKLLVILAYHVK